MWRKKAFSWEKAGVFVFVFVFTFVFVFIFVFVFVLRQRREDVEEEGVFLRERESSIIDGALENVSLG